MRLGRIQNGQPSVRCNDRHYRLEDRKLELSGLNGSLVMCKNVLFRYLLLVAGCRLRDFLILVGLNIEARVQKQEKGQLRL